MVVPVRVRVVLVDDLAAAAPVPVVATPAGGFYAPAADFVVALLVDAPVAVVGLAAPALVAAAPAEFTVAAPAAVDYLLLLAADLGLVGSLLPI